MPVWPKNGEIKLAGIENKLYFCTRQSQLVTWMSGLVTGLQNQLERFDSASDLNNNSQCTVNWCIAIFLFHILPVKKEIGCKPSIGIPAQGIVCTERETMFFSLHHLLNPGGLITSPQLELKPGVAGLAFPSTILQLCHSGTTSSLGPCVLRRPPGCHSFFYGILQGKKSIAPCGLRCTHTALELPTS